ncbi:hypothetical protein F5B20DRAFT_576541 [Whalleya microplaca]|nr:hypothetical protein F5B20DRAFT_576541 [Whalleya microplaca]
MNRTADLRQASGTAKQAVAKPDTRKQNYTRHHRHAKSQPFDADDLRRRLHVVIAEQEEKELQERKRRARLEALERVPQEKHDSATDEHAIEESDTTSLKLTRPVADGTSFAARMAKDNRATADSPLRANTNRSSGRSKPKSLQDKLRRKSSRGVEPTAEHAEKPTPYHHVPQEAAAQFARTATAISVGDRSLVHSLSQAALSYHMEGSRPSDRAELEASMTPAQQQRALRRAQSYREKLHERNQFQQAHVPQAEERSSSEESLQHNAAASSRGKASGCGRSERQNSFGNILEDEVLAVVHPPPAIHDLPADQISSEETLVVDPATANEHRVDWTQSDEVYEKPKRTKSPLLRKADSIWTLKARLGNFTKQSHHNNNRGEKPVVREKEAVFAAALSPPPQKSHSRFGFLARFKR